MITWKNEPKSIEGYAGFVYIIINKIDDKFYIGQKKFFKNKSVATKKTLTKEQVLKRKKLQDKYDNGFFKTKGEYNEAFKKLKKDERTKRANRKRKTRKILVETDWREYLGSNQTGKLEEDILKHGIMNFEKKILICCESKGMMNYAETFLQMKYGILFTDKAYNGLVNIKANTRMFQNIKPQCQEMLKKLEKL